MTTSLGDNLKKIDKILLSMQRDRVVYADYLKKRYGAEAPEIQPKLQAMRNTYKSINNYLNERKRPIFGGDDIGAVESTANSMVSQEEEDEGFV